MEGVASNFETVLSHFQENLKGALYVAVDMELTGTTIDNRPDKYEEYAEERIEKFCEIAESHIPIQIGFTVVRHTDDKYHCASYNFYSLPWMGPELLEPDPSFLCRLSALKFNADRNLVDFNKWLRDGVPYMTREDESNYLLRLSSRKDIDLPRKTGLLRLWKLLCESKLPLVTHCPLDIFFLLTCFERRKLPRDPRELSQLMSECLPFVFDTAHLHSAIGGFHHLKLVKFLEEAKGRYHTHALAENAPSCCFHFDSETQRRYGSGRHWAHEAGFDSLCTAQLYAYLLNLSQDKVVSAVNRLFLYKSTEFLDLVQARENGEIGSSVFGFGDEMPLVMKLDRFRGFTRKQLSSTGVSYRWIDSSHVLLILSSAHIDWAIKFGALSFEQWRSSAHSQTSDLSGDCNIATVQQHGPTNAAALLGSVDQTNAAAWLGDDCSNLKHHGVIKTFDASQGYGFIACPDTYAIYKRDVFVHHSQMHGLDVAQLVSFAVSINSRGQPQAKDVMALGGYVQDMDNDEIQTTTGASSNIGSDDLSDYESCQFSYANSEASLLQ
eukprot:CAMPEP_0169119560 /NCGR_PEP_ID=MMETSP1015-20121227/31626_1 /TAXON_ID=342587 /ORGANISM="Karlodinium micrum, Strain CCMP2283" /LENGTH=551 /DNA_ID=CAMNT_0009182457 /DNA_START=6 /DNA_END=1661 /DNA_ORIENTATION=+